MVTAAAPNMRSNQKSGLNAHARIFGIGFVASILSTTSLTIIPFILAYSFISKQFLPDVFSSGQMNYMTIMWFVLSFAFILSISIWLLIMDQLVRFRGRADPSIFMLSRRDRRIFTFVFLGAIIAYLIAAAQLCTGIYSVSPVGITNFTAFGQAKPTISWSQIRNVKADCEWQSERRGPGHWRYEYIAYLNDGSNYSLSTDRFDNSLSDFDRKAIYGLGQAFAKYHLIVRWDVAPACPLRRLIMNPTSQVRHHWMFGPDTD